MIIDGLFIYHLIKELNGHLTDARLEKIYQTNPDVFLFVFYRQGQRNYIELSLNSQSIGVFLTDEPKNDRMTSQFLITLKKHLESAILKEIKQYETDRVMIFEFITYDFIDGPVPIQLILELMGKHSNLILVKDKKIIESYKKMFFEEGRQLIPQADFEFFPSNKRPFSEMTLNDFDSPKTIVDHFMGISPLLAQYIFEHKKLPLDLPFKPTRSLKTQKAYMADIFPDDEEKIHFETLSSLFQTRQEKKRKSTSSHQIFIERQLQKYLKKKELIEASIEQSIESLNMKNKADLIYESLIPLSEKRSSIAVNDQEILLDPNLTLNENAQKFYQEYQKSKRAITHQNEQLNLTKELIDTFLTFETYFQISEVDQLIDLEEELKIYGYQTKRKIISKKKNTLPKITKIVDENAIYYIGKNSKQNDYLIHQIAQKGDVWFHVKDAPGGHIILQTNQLSEPVIRKAAKLAALFSSLRFSSSIPIDYTEVKNLRKIPGKPGFNVTYKTYQTIYIDLDEAFMKNYLNSSLESKSFE